MRIKGLVILLVVLGGLLGLFFAERMGEHAGEPYFRQLVSLDPEMVTRVRIEGPKGVIVLERRPDGWRLTDPVDYPADRALVEGTVSLFATLSSNGLISSNPDKAELFEVDDAHAVKVALFYADEADPRVRVRVGKLAPDFSSTYVQVDGSPEVNEVSGALRFQVERDSTAWRDKTVLAFDPAAVTEVTLKGAAATAHLRRGEDGWAWAGEPAPAGAVAGDTVDRLVKQLSALRAHSFDDNPPEPPAEPLLAVTLAREGDANPIDLVVESESEGLYRVVAEANPQRFLVPKGVLADLVPDPVKALTAPAATARAEASPAPAASPTVPPAASSSTSPAAPATP